MCELHGLHFLVGACPTAILLQNDSFQEGMGSYLSEKINNNNNSYSAPWDYK